MLIYTWQSSGRKKRSKSKRFLQAQVEHQKFLESVGFFGKRKNVDRSYNMPDLSVESRGVATSDNLHVDGGYKRSVDDYKWKRDRTETVATAKEIERKKTKTAPAYNKGGYQYITDGCDPTTLGRKI